MKRTRFAALVVAEKACEALVAEEVEEFVAGFSVHLLGFVLGGAAAELGLTTRLNGVGLLLVDLLLAGVVVVGRGVGDGQGSGGESGDGEELHFDGGLEVLVTLKPELDWIGE